MAEDGHSAKETLWTIFALVPFEVEIVLKEQICAEAIATMKSILRDRRAAQDSLAGMKRY